MADVDHPEDDWAPLTAEQLAMRPGEQVQTGEQLWDGGASRAPSDSKQAKPVAPMPPAHVEEPVNERGEQMLRELQDRISNARPVDSLISHMQQREQRAARKRQAAQRAKQQLEDSVVVAAVLPPGACEASESPESGPPASAQLALDRAPEPVLEVDKATDQDPRELEEWFSELPPEEQQRLRTTWHEQRHKFDHVGKAWRRRMGRALGYGALVFAVDGAMMAILWGGWGMFLCFLLVGPLAGGLAQLVNGERFTYALLGALGFIVAMGSAMVQSPVSLYGLLFAASAMAAVAMDGEMRRSAGFCDD